MPSRRQERINGRLVEEISVAIPSLKDPRIGFLTVTRAEVSPDLHHARIFVSIFGDEVAQKETLAGLGKAAGHLRHMLGQTLTMKYIPRLEFRLDESIATADSINQLIKKARASDPNHGENSESAPNEDPSGEADA